MEDTKSLAVQPGLLGADPRQVKVREYSNGLLRASKPKITKLTFSSWEQVKARYFCGCQEGTSGSSGCSCRSSQPPRTHAGQARSLAVLGRGAWWGKGWGCTCGLVLVCLPQPPVCHWVLPAFFADSLPSLPASPLNLLFTKPCSHFCTANLTVLKSMPSPRASWGQVATEQICNFHLECHSCTQTGD